MKSNKSSEAVLRDAIISDCGQYRYFLSRVWAPGNNLLFIMLNPSVADSNIDDPTIRRCIRFAKDQGYAGISVVNLFAYRATDPNNLKAAGYPVGPENDFHITNSIKNCATVCVAWGDRAKNQPRVAEVLHLIEKEGKTAFCLSVTKHGLPSHPLMLSAKCKLHPFDYTKIT